MRRVLVLGGTGWLGRAIARSALRTGAEVVCLARGESGVPPAGARLVRADRRDPGAYDALSGDWDHVVELSYQADLVEPALEELADRARHWTLISTMSVYRRNDETGANETAEVLDPLDLSDYGQAKVAAERASSARLGDRLVVARAGLIVGPGDPSDRFGYWVARLHRGGPVLIPETARRYVQVIDVGDLAEWVVTTGLEGRSGVFNVTGSSLPLAEFLTSAAAVSGYDGELRPVSDEWLLRHDVHYWAGPRSLPLWLPVADTGFARRDNAAFLAAGGRVRPIAETLRRVLDDEIARGPLRPRRAGLTAEEETHLLRLRADGPH